MVESYLRREFQDVSLLVMALCRRPHAFPSDRASLRSLVGRISRAGDSAELPQILEGAPKSSPHPSDELWVWLCLGEDGSIQLTAFQGIEQARVSTSIDAAGHLGPFVVSGPQPENAAGQDVSAPQPADGGNNGGTRLSGEAEDPQAVRAAEDMIFRAALMTLARLDGVFEVGAHLDELAESMHQKLRIPVTLAEESRAGDGQSGLLHAPMSSRQDVGEMMEIGPVDGGRIQLRARVRGKQCSGWLTTGGRLVELGSEMIVRVDSN